MSDIKKITIVATGLMSIVPHGNGEGVTLLLRDAFLSRPVVRMPASNQAPECPVGLHVPLILQHAGDCAGDCAPFNMPETAPSGAFAALRKALSTQDDRDLRWLPTLQSIELGAVVPLSSPDHSPVHPYQLGNGTAKVEQDCLLEVEVCPIVTRFRVPSGGLKSCRLAQGKDRHGDLGDALFAIAALGASISRFSTPLTEAYSIEIETNLSGPLEIRATNFAGGRTIRTAMLKPDQDGQITLLVANLPLAESDPPVEGCDDIGGIHTASLYDLARHSWGAGSRYVPHYGQTIAQSSHLGLSGCRGLFDTSQGWAAILQKLKFEYPANPRKCKPIGLLSE